MKHFLYKIIVSIVLAMVMIFSGIVYGQKVVDFTLEDYSGKRVTLSDFKDAKATVVMFIATQCPVSNAYNERMVKLYNEFSGKGIAFVAVNSNKQESVEEIKKHAKEHKFAFPVLKDNNNVIADKYNAQVTPEVFVVDSDLKLLYHGAIDDSRREDEVKSNSLKNALEEILAGKKIMVATTKAFGCSIKRIN